jgi:asparagine synthase (glutamine-hydrolysing)
VCVIAGIVAKKSRKDIGGMLQDMMKAMHRRRSDAGGFAVEGVTNKALVFDKLRFDARSGRTALGFMRLSTEGERHKLQPLQPESRSLSLLHCGEIYNSGELQADAGRSGEEGDGSGSEALLALLEKRYEGDLAGAARTVLPKVDGVYALALSDNKQTVIARDGVGVRQLYLAEHDEYVAFASEKKGLLALTTDDRRIRRLLPGHMALIGKDGYRDTAFWSAEALRSDERIWDGEKALARYGEVVEDAVRKRVVGKDRVGIVFSGGVDSVLIAYLVKKLGLPFTCYTAGREGAVDIQYAKTVAKKLGFPLKTKTITTQDIADLIPQVIRDIEDHSFNQVEAAIALYVAAGVARESGEHTILTGQGADELFGGYSWYPAIVDHEGYEAFEKHSWEDATLSYSETFERENKIATAHGLKMTVPFVDPEVIKVAFQITPDLKINLGNDRIGKRVHREYAISMGIPEEIALREKEAAQHGANVHRAFLELADKKGIDEAMLRKAGYDVGQSVLEVLGSSSRYGYRYGDQDLWEPFAHVQYYLDCRAASVGLLPQRAAEMLGRVNQKLQEIRIAGEVEGCA